MQQGAHRSSWTCFEAALGGLDHPARGCLGRSSRCSLATTPTTSAPTFGTCRCRPGGLLVPGGAPQVLTLRKRRLYHGSLLTGGGAGRRRRGGRPCRPLPQRAQPTGPAAGGGCERRARLRTDACGRACRLGLGGGAGPRNLRAPPAALRPQRHESPRPPVEPNGILANMVASLSRAPFGRPLLQAA